MGGGRFGGFAQRAETAYGELDSLDYATMRRESATATLSTFERNQYILFKDTG